MDVLQKLIRRWERDVQGLAGLEKTCARNRDYEGARDAVTTSDTMRAVIEDARLALSTPKAAS